MVDKKCSPVSVEPVVDMLVKSLNEMLGDEAEWFKEHPDDNDKRGGDSLGKSIYRARWMKRERARQTLDFVAKQAGEPVAYLHTMWMELGQIQSRLTHTASHPFGLPGKHYSEEYKITSTPLYASAIPSTNQGSK